MKFKLLFVAGLCTTLLSTGCSNKFVKLTDTKLNVVNREIESSDAATNTLRLTANPGDGLVILEDMDFDQGTIELELKGKNIRGRSFIGLAFNVQNDTTYEAVYFRPFNFQAEKEIGRKRSVQYISHPINTWRYLRTNHPGKYESNFPRQPEPEEWFTIRVVLENTRVEVFDTKTSEKLLSVERLEDPKSKTIALWMGNNSKGEFRNVKIVL